MDNGVPDGGGQGEHDVAGVPHVVAHDARRGLGNRIPEVEVAVEVGVPVSESFAAAGRVVPSMYSQLA